jgi:hypothetical protein
MNGFNALIKAGMPISSRTVLASLMSLFGICLMPHPAQAMGFGQMETLAGTALLDARADAVLNDCGLPAAIADTADRKAPRQTIRWADTDMKLSSMNWDLLYTRQQKASNHGNGWINPGSGSVKCLPSDLSGLVLHAKGDAGILTVRKRADNNGYITTYHVPDDRFAAHQVVGLTGNWKQGMAASKIVERYGEPDEIQKRTNGTSRYLYWVVARNNKAMPVSVHAVEFEVKGAEKSCTRYTVHTVGVEFVQEKFDELQRQWEKDYVLD